MDNMLDISREAFPNPALTRLSSVLHESESATQRGIDRAFPASLTGLAEHAKRGHAEDLLEHFQSGDYPHLTPAEVPPLIKDPIQTARLAASGEGFLAQIFGEKLDQIVDMVAHQAGVSRTSAHVILGLSAPLLLDALGKESELRHLDAPGLSRFLSEQEEYAHSLQPGVVDGAISATLPPPMPMEAGRDTTAAPFFGGGPIGEAPLSSAAYVSAGIPLSQVHGQRVMQAPTLDENVEERFGEPGKLTRGLLWLLGALLLISLMSWGLLRLSPRPQTPAVPVLPRNVGASEPARDHGTDTSLPGGVTGAAATPSEPATQAAISANKPDVMPRPINQPTTPELPAVAPNTTGGVSPSDRVTSAPPPLAGEAAVRALAKNSPTGRRADAVRTVKPPPSEADIAALGTLAVEPVPSVSTSAGTTDGIVETQRTNVPKAATGAALPAFFVGGALPPRRFILREVEFAEGSSQLPEHSRVLDRAAEALREQSGATVMIQGYAGAASSAERTELLSKERAEAVKRYLVQRGVPASRLKTAGMADTRPAHGLSDRRVELVVLSR